MSSPEVAPENSPKMGQIPPEMAPPKSRARAKGETSGFGGSISPEAPPEDEGLRFARPHFGGSIPPETNAGLTRSPEPLDTPPDWFDRIAKRQAEWRDLGAEAALRLWHSRGDASLPVLAVMGVHVEPSAGKAPRKAAKPPTVAPQPDPAQRPMLAPSPIRFTTQGALL